ncbi:RES family NAD+ phosphorylase [Aquimarina intermedia]|uniref:RES domain-containing protein n=1 Tax=Aquimarina intermedia TaxID=350814 RepID=A0A5S5BZ30_9FLAO|nr:RES family NAD+ phosphorylase [Aquimarina intermedia]TYP72199.1 RES domain-containing protein [Aquimarina intermedia]
MRVFRIAKDQYIRDLTGIGAKTVGGRWNAKGVAILYTSTSAALSILEVLAHLPASFFPDNMSIATIDIPDKFVGSFVEQSLPMGWDKIPPPIENHDFTMNWIHQQKYVGFKIPSSIIPKEQNLLLNPSHPNFKSVKIIDVEPFSFDPRLLTM